MIQNLVWAACYNVVAIGVAPVFAWAGFALSPAAAGLMSASTIVVALNAQARRRILLTPKRDDVRTTLRARRPGTPLLPDRP
nr:hypothetical protein [Micromonospora purpureochromogenes]